MPWNHDADVAGQKAGKGLDPWQHSRGAAPADHHCCRSRACYLLSASRQYTPFHQSPSTLSLSKFPEMHVWSRHSFPQELANSLGQNVNRTRHLSLQHYCSLLCLILTFPSCSTELLQPPLAPWTLLCRLGGMPQPSFPLTPLRLEAAAWRSPF